MWAASPNIVYMDGCSIDNDIQKLRSSINNNRISTWRTRLLPDMMRPEPAAPELELLSSMRFPCRAKFQLLTLASVQSYIVSPADLVDIGVGLDLTLKVNIFALLDGVRAELEAETQAHYRRI